MMSLVLATIKYFLRLRLSFWGDLFEVPIGHCLYSAGRKRCRLSFSAGVAELADAPDLGSGGQPPWRFEPSRRYQFMPFNLRTPLTFPQRNHVFRTAEKMLKCICFV